MSDGELAYLALVIGSFVGFGIAMIWLRADYVTYRRRHPLTTASSQAQMAE